MKNKSSTPFILYVVGITVMALFVLIAIKSYIAFNGLVSEDTKI
ncbi:hypothetical protein [Vallitalea guaymasensis]|nr:hypothetical protein [Vallitalea guaymasensis]